MTWEHHLKLIAAEPEDKLAVIAVVEVRDILAELARLRETESTEIADLKADLQRIGTIEIEMVRVIESQIAEIARLRVACQSVLNVINLLGRGRPIVIGLPVIRELEQALEGKP